MMRRGILVALLLLPGFAFARTHIGIQSPIDIPATTPGPIQVSLNFTDPVPGFSAASTTLLNATIDTFASAGDDRNFSFTIVPLIGGPFSMDIPEGTVGDNNIDFLIESVYAPPPPDTIEEATSTEDATSTPPVDTPPSPPPPSVGGGGSGSAGGATPQNTVIPPSLAATETVVPAETSLPAQTGKVLGAATYRFTTYLARGMDGQDVLNLQKVLISLGLLGKSHAVGHFGPLTEAAVRAYQAARGLTQAGVIGPLTRAALNKEDLSILN